MDLKKRIIELHDLIKENPFWTGFDKQYVKSIHDQYTELMSAICVEHGYVGKIDDISVYKTNWGPILTDYSHDVNHYSYVIRNASTDNQHFQKGIQYLQEFLTMVHLMIEEYEPMKNCKNPKFSWTYKTKYIKGEDSDGKTVEGWYKYIEIERKYKESLLNYWKDRLENGYSYMKNYYESQIKKVEGENETYYEFI